jgi:hypothetical protein
MTTGITKDTCGHIDSVTEDFRAERLPDAIYKNFRNSVTFCLNKQGQKHHIYFDTIFAAFLPLAPLTPPPPWTPLPQRYKLSIGVL